MPYFDILLMLLLICASQVDKCDVIAVFFQRHRHTRKRKTLWE